MFSWGRNKCDGMMPAISDDAPRGNEWRGRPKSNEIKNRAGMIRICSAANDLLNTRRASRRFGRADRTIRSVALFRRHTPLRGVDACVPRSIYSAPTWHGKHFGAHDGLAYTRQFAGTIVGRNAEMRRATSKLGSPAAFFGNRPFSRLTRLFKSLSCHHC